MGKTSFRSKMCCKSSILFFICLVLLQIVIATDDEFYCYKHPFGDYELCQTCRNIKWNPDCNKAEECKCANIRLRIDGTLQGGVSDCNEKKWCYVSEDAKCEDIEADYETYEIDLADGGPFYKSSEACDSKHDKTGNEALLENTKITSDHLQIKTGDEKKLDVVLFMDTVEECKEECESRNGKGGCGAWSYDKEEGDCFIHNVDACCGQFGKQEKNPNFTSGYSCNICWSTKRDTDCPCSADDRTPEAESAHSTGADSPKSLTSTALLAVFTTEVPKDPCSCRRGRRRKGKNKCAKRCLRPLCKGNNNPNGACEDTRRCRLRGRTLDQILQPGGC